MNDGLGGAVDKEMKMIGGVLTYRSKGRPCVCGQTIGADGSGEFAFVIEGSSDSASDWARDHIRELEKSGTRLEKVTFVPAEECYSGPMIQIVTPNAK